MKNVLITGAGGGLGKSFIKYFAKLGYDLYLTSFNENKLKLIAEDTLKEFPNVKIDYFPCDLSLKEERDKLFSDIESKELQFDFIINNAGFVGEGEFLNVKREDVLKIVRVNMEANIDIIHTLVSKKADEKRLNIINIASLSAYYSIPHLSVYSASKAFVRSYCYSLNYELKDKNVHLLAVCPSGMPTTTDMKYDIMSQGVMGKWTSTGTNYIARKSVKKCLKNKTEYVPLFINKFLVFISKFASRKFITKGLGKRWKKTSKKALKLKQTVDEEKLNHYFRHFD